jgi:nucleoside-diphosphate-sugar epimerase
MKQALITGATGFIGSTLCEELVSQGITVRALHRRGSNTSFLRTLPVELAEGDITDRDSLRAAMHDCDAVFHLAALFREAKFPSSEYWRVNLEGTRNVLDLAAEIDSVRYVGYCSTTGVLGDVKSPPADETTPYAPLDVYQESKTDAEKLALERFRSGQITGSVIRPAMVYGPRDTRLLKLFRGIARRTLPIIGSGKTWCHWVLARDVARAFFLAAQSPASSGNLYIVGGAHPISLEQSMKIIADEYGVSLLPFRIPVLPIQLLGSAVEALCLPLRIEPPIHRRRADFFIKNRSFDCSRAQRDFGYSPTLPVEEEIRFVARWYRDNGWVSPRANGSKKGSI